jgi:hypothetical protein|tara:strand:+ start:3096 stop:3329 length:234 start_codon:yes stop_codon:yes gene_type:complete
MNIDLQIGDTILTGRFKNKKIVVKEFGVDDKGQPTVNGRPMLKFRIKKLMPGEKETPVSEILEAIIKKSHKKLIGKK